MTGVPTDALASAGACRAFVKHRTGLYLAANLHAQDCRAESWRRLGAAGTSKEAACSVCDLLHCCARHCPASHKLEWLQTRLADSMHQLDG